MAATDFALADLNHVCLIHNATYTKPISTGTLINGPITAANASWDAIVNVPTATAIASSKMLLAAVNDCVA